uniref:Aminoacyl-tRNA hydrolase n=1 Tax=Steinernema glaseri TaxID=37863 RepID=A0A1I7ZEH0_9BILA
MTECIVGEKISRCSITAGEQQNARRTTPTKTVVTSSSLLVHSNLVWWFCCCACPAELTQPPAVATYHIQAQRAHHRGGGGGGGGGGRGRGKEGPTGGETDGRKTRNITGTNNARASLSDRRAALSVRWTARRTDRHRVEDGRAHNSDGQKSAPRLTKTCRP